MQIHAPTVVPGGVEGGGGAGVAWAEPALEFLTCFSISKRFYLQWKAFDLL